MQCESLTKNKKPCKNTAINGTNRCHVHSNVFGKCAICLDDIIRNAKITQCGHIFHNNCLCNWSKIKNNCPVCRTLLTIDIHPAMQNALKPFLNNPDFETILDIALNCKLDTLQFRKQIKLLGY